MRTDDDVVEIGTIRPKRTFIVGALVEIVPSYRIQLRLRRFCKVEHIYLFQQGIGQLAEFLLRLKERRCGKKLTESAECFTSGHRRQQYHSFEARAMITLKSSAGPPLHQRSRVPGMTLAQGEL